MVRDMMMGNTNNTISSSRGGDMNMNHMMGMMNMKPAWLERLMGETFFGDCGVHKNQRKNEKSIFCLHCCLSICPHCLSSHASHPLLQVLLLHINSFFHSFYTQLYIYYSHINSIINILIFVILINCIIL
jgi:hypothetical protein